MQLRLEVVRNGAIVGISLSVFAFLLSVAMAPYQVTAPYGYRATRRAKAKGDSAYFALFEPLVAWMGAHVDKYVVGEFRDKIEKQLRYAGDWYGLMPSEYVGMAVLGGLLLGFVGLLTGTFFNLGLLMGLMGVILGAAMPYAAVNEAIEHRRRTIGRGLPGVIDQLALAMSAGLDFPGGIRQVIDSTSDPDGPMVDELSRILQELALGQTRKDALIEFAQRVPVPMVGEFVAAVVQAEEKGNPVIDVLLVQAQVSRTRRSVLAEENASKAGVAMAGPLLLVFMCTMIIILAPLLLSTNLE
jgi:tight adherence protein C